MLYIWYQVKILTTQSRHALIYSTLFTYFCLTKKNTLFTQFDNKKNHYQFNEITNPVKLHTYSMILLYILFPILAFTPARVFQGRSLIGFSQSLLKHSIAFSCATNSHQILVELTNELPFFGFAFSHKILQRKD